MDEALLLLRIETELRWNQLVDVQAVERPAMPFGNGQKFASTLRQGDVKAAFAAAHAVEEELQAEGRLPGPGAAFDQVGAVSRVATCQNFIKAWNPGWEGHRIVVCGVDHSGSGSFLGANV
jgi:hypothetical protein